MTFQINHVARWAMRLGTTAALAVLVLPAGLHAAVIQPRLPAATQCGQGEIARVQAVSGHLETKRLHGKWTQARAGMALHGQEEVRTSARGRAALTLCDGGSLYLNRGSDATLKDHRTTLVKTGEIEANLGASSQERIQTRAAEARPADQSHTTLDVRTAGKVSTVITLEGSTLVSNKHGSVTVSPGLQTVVPADQSPAKPSTVDAGAVTSWANGFSWRVLSQPGQLHEPQRLTVDSQGNVYVADTGNSRVVKISSAGQQLAAWGSKGSGPGQFDQPIGIALDTTGNVYVVDDNITQPQIAKLSPAGQELTRFVPYGPNPGQVEFGTALAVDTQGNMYVTDTYPGTARVQKLSSAGDAMSSWGFVTPVGVTLDSAGNIYVVDQDPTHNIYQVIELSPSGAPIAHWGGVSGTAPGQFDTPTDVAVDAHGNIYVADAGNNRIQELSPSGQVLGIWGTKGAGSGQFDAPQGVALDAQGNIYVVEKGNNRVQRYAAAS